MEKASNEWNSKVFNWTKDNSNLTELSKLGLETTNLGTELQNQNL